jgi:hypothetical protein
MLTCFKNKLSMLVSTVVFFTLLGMTVLFNASTAHAAGLFDDDFESGAGSWTVKVGTWSVVTDGSTQVYNSTSTTGNGRTVAGQSSWTNYKVEAQIKVDTWGSTSKAGLVARYQDEDNYYFMLYENSTSSVKLFKRSGGVNTVIAQSSALTAYEGIYNSYRLELNGSTLTGYFNDLQVLSATDSTFTSGSIGLYTVKQLAYFDDVKVSDFAETVWNVNSLYGVTQSGIASAISDAKTYFTTHPHDTLVLQFNAGTYNINNDNNSTTGIIDISNVDPGAWDGRLVFRGGGQSGANSTTFVFDDSLVSLYGKNIYHVTFESMHMTRADLKVSQGIVASVAPGSVTLDIQSGFPTPQDIFNPNSTTGRYLRAYDNTDPLDPQIIGNDTWPPSSNAQIPWKTATQVSGFTNRWQINLNNATLVAGYSAGDLIGIKSKHGGDAYWFSVGSDFVFNDVKWTKESRGVFRTGFDHIRISNSTIDRGDPINGQLPALASPDGGPQLGNQNDVPVSNIVVENCYIEGTGDDAIAYFKVTGIIRSNYVKDPFTRILLYQSPNSVIDGLGNTLIRTPVYRE